MRRGRLDNHGDGVRPPLPSPARGRRPGPATQRRAAASPTGCLRPTDPAARRRGRRPNRPAARPTAVAVSRALRRAAAAPRDCPPSAPGSARLPPLPCGNSRLRRPRRLSIARPGEHPWAMLSAPATQQRRAGCSQSEDRWQFTAVGDGLASALVQPGATGAESGTALGPAVGLFRNASGWVRVIADGVLHALQFVHLLGVARGVRTRCRQRARGRLVDGVLGEVAICVGEFRGRRSRLVAGI